MNGWEPTPGQCLCCGGRGLLPVMLDEAGTLWKSHHHGSFSVCRAGTSTSDTILADPRPDGAQ